MPLVPITPLNHAPPLPCTLSHPGSDELQLRLAAARNGDPLATGASLASRADQNGTPASPLATAAAAAAAQQRLLATANLEVWQASAAPGQTRHDWVLEKCSSLLLVLAHADAAVKATMCSKDGLQSILDCLQRLQPPHLAKVGRVQAL